MKDQDQTRALPSAETLVAARRRFVTGGTLTAVAAAIGVHIPFGRFMPEGLVPVALANTPDDLLASFGKKGLIVLGDKPLVAETPAHLLDDAVTPVAAMFVRNNGGLPDKAALDPAKWTLTIDGESVEKPVTFTLAEIKARFPHVTQQVFVECGGNGRSEFQPPAKGNQWTHGGVGFPEFTGVRLSDLLKVAGVKKDAVYIGSYGIDPHLSGDTSKPVISRGVPIAKAMEPETLLVWAMNGRELPLIHGYPLRLIVGGVPASVCSKWLNKIVVRNKIHDGPKMGGHDYRLPNKPVAPGEASDDYGIMETMPVKSIITFPRSGIQHAAGAAMEVRGQAWTGADKITAVDVSIDFGQTWQKATLLPARNRFAPHRFKANIRFPTTGYYEVWARATDSTGRGQPMVSPGWNTGGYGNNATHRIAVRVA
ncbi:MAG: sulfite oxidase [Burkholderiaceae bacterium]